jgi:hypothetical protein
VTFENKKLPIFLGEGEEQIQIGEVLLDSWRNNYTQVIASIDVFPGELLGFSRIVRWEDVLGLVEFKYPKGEKMADEKAAGGSSDLDRLVETPFSDQVQKIRDAMVKDKENT